MWSSRLFWKIFSIYIALILLTIITFVVLSSQAIQSLVDAQVGQRLKTNTYLIREKISYPLWSDKAKRKQVQSLVKRLGDENEIRVTLILLSGDVIADSKKLPGEMDNHKNRPEIAAAARTGEGTDGRMSSTLKEQMRYYALEAKHQGTAVGVVRCALSLTEIEKQINGYRRILWGIGVAICLCTLGLTYYLVANILSPVKSLTQAAKSLFSGETILLDISNKDELGILADTFNQAQIEIRHQIGQIRGNREQLATVLEGMVEGVITTDRQEKILFANAAAAKLLNTTADRLTGKLLIEFARNHLFHEVIQNALQGEISRNIEAEMLDKQGMILSINATPLPGDPCPGVVLVLHDVTEIKRLESLRREFVANVSHELKTPLSAIKAYAETLQRGALEDSENNVIFVQRIEQQADRLHQLILDMLSLARIESGQHVFELALLPMNETMEAIVGENQAAAQSKQIELINQPSEEPLFIHADEEGFKQILNNLISNAINYSSIGGKIVVRSLVDSQDNSLVILEVEDNGLGISQHDQKRIFERFYRADKARSRELGGTGLGLSIVKHLAQSFGGEVQVESALQKGSTFRVIFPRSNSPLHESIKN